MPDQENHLVRIFKDVSTHKEVAGVISRNLTSETDIRDVALNNMDLGGKHSVLDLGCGFGFFTEGLSGKNHEVTNITGIDCHPEYEWFYFHSCEKVGTLVKKKFISQGIETIKSLPSRSYDIILCSYALYFFPEMIPEIARVMKKDGLFIAITHAMPHLHQFSDYVRAFLVTEGVPIYKENPYEALIRKFSDKNGLPLLSKEFDTICTRNYRSKLVFGKEDFDDFTIYFKFKHNFFIPSSLDPDDRLHSMVLDSVKDYLDGGRKMEITKDDVIFICSDPVKLS
jgi:ubiquinone/menaquinone biosynthesis C-methylase UbiE